MIREFSVGVVVYFVDENKNIEYLALCYKKNKDFPKGKLKPGESKKEAALRELREEAGVVVGLDKGFEHKISYRFHNKDKVLVSKEVTFFTGKSNNKNVEITEEHDDFVWLPYEEMRSVLTYDNSVRLLDLVHAFVMTKIFEK